MKAKYPKLNKRLLNRVLAHIKAEPRRFDMATFGTTVDKDTSPCGTQACIGGWAYFLTQPKGKWESLIQRAEDGGINIEEKARKVLGLTTGEANSLFLTHTFEKGSRAIDTAERKIALLKEDRAKFVEEYPFI